MYFFDMVENQNYPSNPKSFPVIPEGGNKHIIICYDDPEPKYYEQISNVFRLGRPCGISPIVAIHSWEQITKSQ